MRSVSVIYRRPLIYHSTALCLNQQGNILMPSGGNDFTCCVLADDISIREWPPSPQPSNRCFSAIRVSCVKLHMFELPVLEKCVASAATLKPHILSSQPQLIHLDGQTKSDKMYPICIPYVHMCISSCLCTKIFKIYIKTVWVLLDQKDRAWHS